MKTTMRAVALPALALAAALGLAACKDRAETVAAVPAETLDSNPPAAISVAAVPAPLPEPDVTFLTQAAEGGQFEAEVAKLALEKATDPAIKAHAQMLVEDHSAANLKLRQLATAHQLALPAALPDEKKRELELLAKLSGPEFDRRFVKMVGIGDHRHDIGEFEKAGQGAENPDVTRFAQATLPTLKKHLQAAGQLPGAGNS